MALRSCAIDETEDAGYTKILANEVQGDKLERYIARLKRNFADQTDVCIFDVPRVLCSLLKALSHNSGMLMFL